jgi:transcriptional regulator with XRE-family HTH domain
MKFSENLKLYLKSNDIPLNEFARKINVSASTLHGWLNGVEPKSIQDYKKIAVSLGISVDELCFGQISENIETDMRVTIGIHSYRIFLNKVPQK